MWGLEQVVAHFDRLQYDVPLALGSRSRQLCLLGSEVTPCILFFFEATRMLKAVNLFSV